MVERKAKVICSVVGFLGLLSAALGFAAEAKKIKCIFRSRNNCAAVAILVAQIIITTTTGCLCCRRYSYRSNFKRALAVICYSISWVTFVNAFVLFIRSAQWNAHHTDIIKNKDDVCYFLKPGYLAGAAVLALATAVLGIVAYLAWDSGKTNDDPWGGAAAAAAPNQGGIAMAHPQFPPPPYPPPQYPPSNNNPWGGAAAAPNQGGIAMAHPQFPPPQYPPPQYPPSNKQPSAPVFVHEDTYTRRQYT